MLPRTGFAGFAAFAVNAGSWTAATSRTAAARRHYKSGNEPPGFSSHAGGDEDGGRPLLRPHEEGADVRWASGSGGVDWKGRDLDERRDQALEFLFDVSKRQPIHDGLRAQAARNQQRLRMPLDDDEDPRDDPSATSVLMDSLGPAVDRAAEADEMLLGPGEVEAARASNRLIWETAEDLAGMDEGLVAESVANLSDADVRLLAEELYGEASASADMRRDKMLRSWFRLRHAAPRHAGFASLNKEERTEWSAWYLQDFSKASGGGGGGSA